MKTSRAIISIAAAAVCLLGFSSCHKDLSGLQIRFRASTSSKATSTKTAYSGTNFNSGGSVYERIDWVDGDRIVLAMKNNETAMASQQYSVNTISVAGVNSKTDLEPYGSENGLSWGEGTHDFWAAYPASKVTVGDHKMSATIPASQVVKYSNRTNDVAVFRADMSDAFMVAGQQSVPKESGVNLDFYPAFTAFEITVGANDNTTITSFEMETATYETETAAFVPLAGVSTATFNAGSNMSFTFSGTGATSNSISAVFHDDKDQPYNPIISTTAKMNFKVFALPLDITGVTIRFNLSNGTSKFLKLKQNGQWINFPAAAKVQISGLLVPGAVWYINFDYPRKEQWIEHADIEIGVE